MNQVCGCRAYPRPHDHEWTGDEPEPATECEHEWRKVSLATETFFRCKLCQETSEYDV